jgi:hypothetical protein
MLQIKTPPDDRRYKEPHPDPLLKERELNPGIYKFMSLFRVHN